MNSLLYNGKVISFQFLIVVFLPCVVQGFEEYTRCLERASEVTGYRGLQETQRMDLKARNSSSLSRNRSDRIIVPLPMLNMFSPLSRILACTRALIQSLCIWLCGFSVLQSFVVYKKGLTFRFMKLQDLSLCRFHAWKALNLGIMLTMSN